MIKAIIIFALLVATVMTQEDSEGANPAPEPYNFAFESANEDGSSTARQETGDANGRITGFYIIKGLDGQDRRVDYYADETGFHAEVSTSEEGTVSHEADQAIYKSSAGTLDEQIARWEASAAGQEANARNAANRQSSSVYRSSSTTLTTNSGLARAPVSAARQASRTETQRTSSVSASASQVAPEGYVLVSASTARAAGVVGREIAGDTVSNLGLATGLGRSSISYAATPARTTTTTTSRRVQTSSRSGNNVRGRISSGIPTTVGIPTAGAV